MQTAEERYLQGLGFEIGAHDKPLPGGARYFGDRYANYAHIDCCHDILCDAVNLPFPDNSLDYIASSHVIEHLPDNIRALCEWYRVIKPGGYIYTIVPDKRFTFDHPRALTPLEEFWKDFRNSQNGASSEHLEDFLFGADPVRLYPGMSEEQWKQRREEEHQMYQETVQRGGEINLHFHVFERSNVLELIESIGSADIGISWHLEYDIEQYPKNRGDGYLFVIRKHLHPQPKIRHDTFCLNRKDLDPLPLLCPTTLQTLRLVDQSNPGALQELNLAAEKHGEFQPTDSYLVRHDGLKAYPLFHGRPSFVFEHTLNLDSQFEDPLAFRAPRFFYKS